VGYRDARTPKGVENLIAAASGHSSSVRRGVFRWGPPWITYGRGLIALLAVVFAPALARPGPAPAVGFVASFAASFAAAALVCLAVERVVARRRRALTALHADDPWMAVPHWRSKIVSLPPWARGAHMIVLVGLGLGVVAWALVVIHPNYSAVGSVVAGVAGLWSVFWAYRLQNVVFLGTTEVRLRELPLRARSPVVLDFAVGRHGAHFESITFVLMRAVEVMVDVKAAAMVTGTDVGWAGYSHWAEYELPDDQPPPGPGEQVEARFTLPPDASGTDLTRVYPVYWMLEVTGETSCGHYCERFPIPIYDVPGAAS